MSPPTQEGKPRLGARLGRLGIDLLNATLLLCVLLVLGLWLLLGRAQDFAADTAGAITEEVGSDIRAQLASSADGLGQAKARIQALETALQARLAALDTAAADSQTAAELAALRKEIKAVRADLTTLTQALSKLRANLSGSLRATLEQILRDLADTLSPARPTLTGASE